MKAVLLTAVKKLEIRDLPDPEPKAGEAVVAIRACGICGSDVHFWSMGRIGADRCVFPQALGHEASGEVVAVAPGVPFKPGDRVALEPAKPCYACEHCRAGFFNRCPNVKFFASPGQQGAFREFVAVDHRQLEKLPEAVSFAGGAVLEPFGVAYHAAGLARIAKGESVAIFGAGAVGLLTLAMAKVRGAGETFIVDRLGYRLEFAKKIFGADHCIDTTSADPLDVIRDATNGRGVDVSFEAAGEQETFDWSFESCRIGGRSLLIGIPEIDTISFNPHLARRRELLIQNVRRSNQALRPCINLAVKEKINLDAIATHSFDIDKISQAFETVHGYKDSIIRAMITPLS